MVDNVRRGARFEVTNSDSTAVFAALPRARIAERLRLARPSSVARACARQGIVTSGESLGGWLSRIRTRALPADGGATGLGWAAV
jgi:hypothetical protein